VWGKRPRGDAVSSAFDAETGAAFTGEVRLIIWCNHLFGEPSVGNEQWNLPHNGYDLGLLINELRRLP